MERINSYIKSIMQYLLLAFIVLFEIQPLFAQKNLKYKDVYKVVSERGKEEAYSLLLVFQKQEPFFPNTYFQLGLIAQYWSKEYDALTNLNDVEFFIYNTGLYFGLANSKLDSKEIRKNDKYYMNVARFQNVEKLEEEEVRNFIQEQMEANKEYEKNVYLVTNLFNSSIRHYNKCINIFKTINTSNNKIKDIYLTASSGFNTQLNELENSFDSAIYYLQNYQTAIKNYPIKEYSQKYKLLPIETYRLHGLTGSDFLKSEIPIWDYGTWVKNVKQVLNGDIKQLRQAIDKADNQLNKNIDLLLQTNEYKTDFDLPRIDERVKYKIGKFDHKSIMLNLFNYKEAKIEFLTLNRNPVNNNEENNADISLNQKGRYYEELVSKKVICDSLNKQFVNSLNPYDINKYTDFFTNKYGGEEGLKSFSKNEQTLIKTVLDKSLNNFKDYLVKTDKLNNYDSIPYKNTFINLKKSLVEFEKASLNSYYVTDFQKNSSGDYYITGYTIQKANEVSAFIAKSGRLESIKWLKLIPQKKQGESAGMFVQIIENGCEAIISTSEFGNVTNQIVTYDENGKQINKFDLDIKGIPRYFNSDEINQQYLIAFKGSKFSSLDCLNDELIVTLFDASYKSVIWKNNLNLKGQFVDIVRMNQELFVFANFTNYVSDTYNFASQAAVDPLNTNCIALVIDENGKLTRELPVTNKNAFFVTKVIKINSNSINLVGFKRNLVDILEIPEGEYGEFLYLLLDTKGEIYFDNWK